MTVGVAGLGIIGGSFAKSIKACTSHKVLGWNRTRSTLEYAIDVGAVDAELTEENVSQCDIIIAALPPAALVNWVKSFAPFFRRGTVFVDACGVKRAVTQDIEPISIEYGFIYVGGHPMAGKEVSGFSVSSDTLFRGASMILTTADGRESFTVSALKPFLYSLGFGRVTVTTPEEHDRMIAYTSQLCHVASNAFIKSPAAQKHTGYSAGSFRDLTRVAKLDENLWTELFFLNADNLADELELYIGHLNEYLTALRSGNEDSMRDLLREGRELKEESRK
ncbi:MAG: prephenate dehydrogenase [Oscillospiraceae bacterium]|nr:prephenate dehydrogenase [Oscillospiraceae bacterium]